jgi:hypothetical protein
MRTESKAITETRTPRRTHEGPVTRGVHSLAERWSGPPEGRPVSRSARPTDTRLPRARAVTA